MKIITLTRLSAGLALIASAAGAAASANAALPPVEHYGGIAYQTGGVGSDQAALMKQQAGRYPLELEFVELAGRIGEYSAGEQVKIMDAHDRAVFTAQADGPFMLVDLPRGKYKVTANNAGHDEARQVDIQGKSPDRVEFTWPAREIEQK